MIRIVLIFLFLPLGLFAQYERGIERSLKFIDNNDYEKAKDELKDLLPDSNNHQVNMLLGKVHFSLQEFDKAEDNFEKCLEFVEQEEDDFKNLYLTYNFLNKTKEAQNILDLMLDYYPGIDSSKFYNWASQNLRSPCTPDFGIRESLRYCIKMDASASVDANNPNQKLFWETDDGKKYSGTELSHCFKNSGKHLIKLISEDNSLGYVRRSDTTLTVTFLDNNSIILKQESRKSGKIEVSTYKIESDSLSPYMFAWETGDGSVSFDEKLTHTYQKNGEYNIKLTIFELVAKGTYEPICCINKKCIVNK